MINTNRYTMLFKFIESLNIDDDSKKRLVDSINDYTELLLEANQIQVKEDLTWLVQHARFDSHTEDIYAEEILRRHEVELWF